MWRFADHEFDELRWQLRFKGQVIELEAKPLEVLLQLLLHAGEVVTKEELLESVETVTQQKAHPGLCAVNPEKPLQYGEMAWLLPRGDVAMKQWVDTWLHLSKAGGEYDRLLAEWTK